MQNVPTSSPFKRPMIGSDISFPRGSRVGCGDNVGKSRRRFFKVFAAIGIGTSVIGIGGFSALNNKSQPAQQAAQADTPKSSVSETGKAENTPDLAATMQHIVDEYGGTLQITSHDFNRNIGFIKWGVSSPQRDYIDFHVTNATPATLNEALKVTNGSCNLTVEILPDADAMAHAVPRQNNMENTSDNNATPCDVRIQYLRLHNIFPAQLTALRNTLRNLVIYGKLFDIDIVFPTTCEENGTNEENLNALEQLLKESVATNKIHVSLTRDGEMINVPAVDDMLRRVIYERAQLNGITASVSWKQVTYNDRQCGPLSERDARLAAQ